MPCYLVECQRRGVGFHVNYLAVRHKTQLDKRLEAVAYTQHQTVTLLQKLVYSVLELWIAQERNDERMLQREKRKEEQRLLAEADKELRMNKKVSGIANASELNIKPVKTTAAGRQSQPVDMEELSQKVLKEQAEADKSQAMEALSKIRIRGIDDSNIGDVSTRELGPEIGQKKNTLNTCKKEYKCEVV